MRQFSFVVVAGVLSFASPLMAEDSVKTICDNVVKLESEGQIKKALEELSWAQNALNEAHQKKIASLLPAKIGELVGGEAKNVDALGLSATEREYKGAGSSVKLSLIGSASSGKAANNPFAALGQFAMMGAGMDPNARTVRMNGRTATVKQEPGSDEVEVMITLKNGAMIKLEGNGFKDAKKFEELAQAVDLAPLENYLS